jgi:putative ABC transport system ATP-binding protein
MLNLIGGMDSVTEGTVIIDGKDITNYNEAQLSDFRTENIGFIFQFYNILPTLTAIENIELVIEVIGKTVDARQALSDVGLAEHANKFPAQLSGCEQQRISIARAVAKNPRLLLCDEPTGALDSVTGVEVLKLLHSHSRKDAGNTVLIVTHNSLFAEIADTVIHVKNGKIESVNKNKQPKNIDEVKW